QGERQEMRNEPSAAADELASQVIGCAIAVHRELGPGFPERVYEEALVVEFCRRGIPFERQLHVPLPYFDSPVGEMVLDLFVGGILVVELKAVEMLAPIHTAQTISYLKAVKQPLGLLISFHVPVLKHGIKRVILSGP